MIHSQAGEPKSLSDRVMSRDEVLRCAPAPRCGRNNVPPLERSRAPAPADNPPQAGRVSVLDAGCLAAWLAEHVEALVLATGKSRQPLRQRDPKREPVFQMAHKCLDRSHFLEKYSSARTDKTLTTANSGGLEIQDMQWLTAVLGPCSATVILRQSRWRRDLGRDTTQRVRGWVTF
jgi:hypothetical protein